MPVIVAAGESLIDFTPVRRDGRVEAFRVHPGGSPLNVAVGVARLGHRAGFAGRLSEDWFGRLLSEHLDREGVDDGLLERGPEPTMLAFAVVGERGEATYEFRATGTADALIAPGQLSPERLRDARVLHVGSAALARPPGADEITRAAEALKGRLFVSLDPNVRPALVEDWDSYHERLARLAAVADLVKVSECDLEALEHAGRRLRLPARGAPVVVTRGAAGLRVLHAGAVVHEQPAAPADVVDTVGAGDATMAALLVALVERDEALPGVVPDDAVWPEVLPFAAAAGAAACERAGAEPGTRDEIERRLLRGRGG